MGATKDTQQPTEESHGDSTAEVPLGVLTGMQRDILYVIAGIEDETIQTGVTIRDRLEECHPESISHGGFYHNLRSLVDDGYLDRVPLNGRTNTYRLSEEAARTLSARSEWASEHLDAE
jgi:DNA-binding PadR family transcriptional regulator